MNGLINVSDRREVEDGGNKGGKGRDAGMERRERRKRCTKDDDDHERKTRRAEEKR